MTEENIQARHQKIQVGVKAAIAKAIERHRKLGESIAVWQDGKVVVLSADQIPLPDEVAGSPEALTPSPSPQRRGG
jgi:hypothetical protein